MRVGLGDVGANRGVGQTDGSCRPDGRRTLGGSTVLPVTRSNDGLQLGAQQPGLGRQVVGREIPSGGVNDNQPIFCRRRTHHAVLQTQSE